MKHWIFVLLVRILPSLWCVNDLVMLSQSVQSTVVCPREPWSQFPLPGIGALSAIERGQNHESTSVHSSSWGWRARYHTACHWGFASLSFWVQKVGRSTFLWAGLSNLWMRRGLEGCLVLGKGWNYFILVVPLKRMRKRTFFFFFFLHSWLHESVDLIHML